MVKIICVLLNNVKHVHACLVTHLDNPIGFIYG
jgi:hypothetical protein